MKTLKTLCLVALLSLFKIGYAQETYVPDDNFEQALIDLGYDTVLDDYVTTANISGVTSLSIASKNIADLTGIEDFTALTYLYCVDNLLTSLDVSQNTMLTSLECAFNELTSLDISQNTALTNFTCSHNLITSLDVSQNTALSQLSCNNNELTDIDVTLLTGLETLNVFDNHLTSLDVSQNVLLDDLDFSFNEITSIDVTQNTALTLFSCRSNQLTSLDVSQNTALIELPCQDNQFTSLDVTQNTALTYLDCRYNQLTSLNVKNGNNTNFTGFSASTNPDLTCITVDDVAYSTANWTDIDPQTSFSEDCSLSVGDQELNESISIYPNPVKNSLNISIKQDANYSIVAMNGQVVKKGVIAIGENTLDVSSLTQGIYLINLKTDKGNVTKKLILK